MEISGAQLASTWGPRQAFLLQTSKSILATVAQNSRICSTQTCSTPFSPQLLSFFEKESISTIKPPKTSSLRSFLVWYYSIPAFATLVHWWSPKSINPLERRSSNKLVAVRILRNPLRTFARYVPLSSTLSLGTRVTSDKNHSVNLLWFIHQNFHPLIVT